MTIAQTLLPEFDNEIRNVRKTIERVPEDKYDWKPHQKSMTAGQLVSHLAEMASWVKDTLESDSWDMNPPGGPAYEPYKAQSTAELLEEFDKHSASARQALEGVSDEAMRNTWSLLSAGEAFITLPRVAVIRSFVMNHMIHHRGQLSVYLRLLDVPVPALYGPSADEQN